jgi:hypothetical protein
VLNSLPARIEHDGERLGQRGAAAFEVGASDRAADAFEIRGDLAADVAAIEVAEASVGEVVERCRERDLSEPGAHGRGLALDQKDIGKAGHILELRKLLGRDVGLAARDDCALFRVRDGGREQIGQLHASAVGAGHLKRQRPTGDGAGHGQRRQRTAWWNRFVVAVKLAPRVGAGAAHRHQDAQMTGGLTHKPDAVAAQL